MTYFSKNAFSRNSSDSSGIYKKSKKAKASAAVPEADRAPTDGKNIPIIVGAVKMTGDVIWIHTYRNDKNECLCHVAVCFGRNAFGRPLALVSLQQSGNYIYKRSGGDVVDPPKAVRFYDGTQTTTDPKIRNIEGAENTPAFTGYIYAVLEGVKIGEFSAEFTDASVETSPSVSGDCDPTLEGVDLKYHPRTGLFYGIEFPRTSSANIITSDGCTVLRRARIKYDPDILSGHRWFPCPYELHFVDCSDAIIATGYWDSTEPEDFFREPWVWLVRPDSGLVYGGMLAETGPESSSLDYGDPLPETFLPEIKTCFSVSNSSGNVFAALKFFDRSDNLVSAIRPPGAVRLGAESNVSASVFDLTEPMFPDTIGEGRIYGQAEFYNSVYEVYDGAYDGLIGCTDAGTFAKSIDIYLGDPPEDAPATTFTGVAYWTYDFPYLEDMIFLRNEPGRSLIGGVRTTGGVIDYFIVAYNSLGAQTVVSGSIVSLTTWSVETLNYDPLDGQFLISVNPPDGSSLSSRIYKVGTSGILSYVETDGPEWRLVSKDRGVSNGGFAPIQNADGSAVGKIDLETGDIEELYSGAAPEADPIVDLSRNFFYLPTVVGVTKYSAKQIEPDDITLVSVITDFCSYKGYSPSDLVFQNLEGETIKGILIGSTIRLSDLLNRLGTLFSFTFVETDRKLKFLKKRSAGFLDVDAYLTESDLVRPDASDEGAVRTVQRSTANSVIGGMDLEFVDPAKQYENSTIKIRRPAGFYDVGASTRIESLSVPVTVNAADAYRLMYESFYTAIQRQTRVAISVTSWSARIEPGDCVSVTVDGVETIGIAVRVVLDESFTQEIELEVFGASGETQISEPEAPVEPPISNGVPGYYIPLEIPYIRETDYQGATKSVRYHGIGTISLAEWAWADLYRSADGNNYIKYLDYDLSPMTVGRTTSSVGQPAIPFSTDDVNSITVSIFSGSASDLASISYIEQMNGANLCAFGGDGRWELISFQTVVENSDGTLTLSGLQRGLFGTHTLYTSENLGDHQAGDLLVYLDPVKITASQYPVSAKGALEYFSVVTSGTGVSDGASGPFTFQNTAMLQFQPAGLKATHQTGSANLVVSWEEVTCIPARWSDTGADTPMHAETTYDLEITGTGMPTQNITGLTGRTYTLTSYGTYLGVNTNAETSDVRVTITPQVAGIGTGIPNSCAAIEIPA